MRPATTSCPTGARRALTTSVPMAVAGSLTLLLSASPAHATEPSKTDDHRMPRALAPLDGTRVANVVAHTRRVPANTTPETYTVVRGDTVSAIASRHGLRTADVLALNGLSASSVIYPGQILRLAAAAVAAPPAQAETVASAGAYIVQSGDTISSIAQSHGVTVAAVFSANGLGWSSVIHPGQSISIPGTTAPAAPAPAAPPAVTPPLAADTYVVVAGDTMSAIAQSHGVTSEAILAANGLGWSSIIYPGQTISIPGAAVAVLAVNTAPITPAASSDLDAEQIGNVQIIIRVGRELGVPERGIAIALGTAMQESWLRNLDWGDRDSLGLFQQRPSMGWGTADQVRDADRSARTFFGGPSDPNGYATRGLLDIPGWESMSFADAAQAVQISAYPERYAQWEQPAYAWLAAHG